MTMFEHTRLDLEEYQVKTIDFAKATPKCGLFLDMSLGKTIISLTAALDLLRDFSVTKILIVAPLRVANTVWHKEALKWEHTKDIRFSICTGNEKERTLSINREAEIYVINRENIPWLVKNHPWKWDMLIIDESSSFKSHSAMRFKALKAVRAKISRTILLSGTPAPNGLMGLWSQIFLLDGGERLGRNISEFRKRYFTNNSWNMYKYVPVDGAADIIKKSIKDICITMKSEKRIGRVELKEYVDFSPKAKEQYKTLEDEFFLELEKGSVEALSAAAKSGKLLQMCNGAVYDADGNTHHIHDEKLKTLRDIIDDNPSENFLVAYNFKSDLARIKKSFPEAVVMSTSGKECDDWNAGKIKMLLVHPASCGHGLNMQFGGSVLIWFGLNWSLELYQQLNARLPRPGQKKLVRIIHIILKGGMDEKVLEALNNNAETQDDLIKYLLANFK